jgi:DNA-binding PadR family transcriptional regulator
MHGYKIAKEISTMFDGTYVPSAGVIYPTLHWLVDQGYVRGSRSGETTNYTISESGRRFLNKNEDNLSEVVRYLKYRREDPTFPILKSAAQLQKTIVTYLPEMSREKKARVARVLEESNERVLRLMGE